VQVSLESWLAAFAFTQAVEVPIYAIALRARIPRLAPRLAAAFGASAITHPVVWFVIPHLIAHPWLAYVVIAETFAVAAEAAYLAMLGARRPVIWSLAANGASVVLAMATRRLWGFP
jgi:hypothetical protein